MDTPLHKLAPHPMPEIAAFIANLKEVFGDVVIDEAIRRGKDGEPTFYVCEGGRSVDTASPTARNVWKVDGALCDRNFCDGCDGTCVRTGRRCSQP
jgi:hypothetical protein